jgi:hypothetical protein
MSEGGMGGECRKRKKMIQKRGEEMKIMNRPERGHDATQKKKKSEKGNSNVFLKKINKKSPN